MAAANSGAIPAVMPTYRRIDIAFEKGEGVYLYGVDGRRYLDFACGLAVTGLGHAHPYLVKAIEAQAKKVWHVSNLHRIPEQERLAQRLVEATFADTVFFSNSGAEANEALIKVIRKFHSANGHPERYRIITFEGAFHGRTLATLAATGQEKYLEGFGPKVDGFDRVPADGEIKTVEAAIGPETAGILIELIQGEGGIRQFSPEFIRGLRALCDRHGLLLGFDEIQTGMGRTGTLYAYEQLGVTPDVMTLAKGLGNGVPVGAMLAAAPIAGVLDAGSHGSTFGGNALACAAALAVCEVLESEGVLAHARAMGDRLRAGLETLAGRYPAIQGVRGRGLLLGVVLDRPGAPYVDRCRDAGLIINCTANTVLRITPPLTVQPAEIDEALAILDGVLRT